MLLLLAGPGRAGLPWTRHSPIDIMIAPRPGRQGRSVPHRWPCARPRGIPR